MLPYFLSFHLIHQTESGNRIIDIYPLCQLIILLLVSALFEIAFLQITFFVASVNRSNGVICKTDKLNKCFDKSVNRQIQINKINQQF